MIDYDSFSRCHLTDIFFAFHAGAKELKLLPSSIILRLLSLDLGTEILLCFNKISPVFYITMAASWNFVMQNSIFVHQLSFCKQTLSKCRL